MQPNGCRAVKSSLRREQVTYPSTNGVLWQWGARGIIPLAEREAEPCREEANINVCR